MNALCVDGSMSVHEWLSIAESLDVEGVERYAGFIENEERTNWAKFKLLAHESVIPVENQHIAPALTPHKTTPLL